VLIFYRRHILISESALTSENKKLTHNAEIGPKGGFNIGTSKNFIASFALSPSLKGMYYLITNSIKNHS